MKGSSPLTRGKRVPPQRDGEAEGLIPAHAGKTRQRPGSLPARTAHPRSRGENERMPLIMPWMTGSSPLTRGKLIDWFKTYLLPGLIPAHAGKTAAGG